jgi:hypothetical protein
MVEVSTEIVYVQYKDILIDPKFRATNPRASVTEMGLLRENIEADQQITNPFKLYMRDGKSYLVDGHTRHEILPQLIDSGFPPLIPSLYLTADSEEEICYWILKEQIGRRNYTEEQFCYVIGKLSLDIRVDKAKRDAYFKANGIIDHASISDINNYLMGKYARSERWLYHAMDYYRGIEKIKESTHSEALIMDILSKDTPPVNGEPTVLKIGDVVKLGKSKGKFKFKDFEDIVEAVRGKATGKKKQKKAPVDVRTACDVLVDAYFKDPSEDRLEAIILKLREVIRQREAA